MAVSIDQQFIEYIIKSLVGKPEAVKIERRIDEKGVLLELSVDPEDLGRVIGKRGATAQSLRTLLRALGTKNDARYNLKIVDTGPPPDRGQRTDEPSTSSGQDRGQAADDQLAQAVEPVADDSTADEAPAADDAKDEPTKKDDDIDMTEDEELPESPSKETDHADVISKTRKELADLDDLDI